MSEHLVPYNGGFAFQILGTFAAFAIIVALIVTGAWITEFVQHRRRLRNRSKGKNSARKR